MIALTKSGYEKFIKGTLHLPTDTRVAILSGETGLSNSVFTTSNINVRRAQANPNNREFEFYDFNARRVANTIRIEGQVNFNTMDFAVKGDEKVDNNAAVIDVSDNDDLIGSIILYPSSDPITYSALNSAPVNIDYTATTMAKMIFQTTYNDLANDVRYNIAGAVRYNRSYTFINSILNLPIFNSSTQTNLLSDMKIALLSSTGFSTGKSFAQRLFADSQTLSTIENLDSSSNYHYISGGFEFRNLDLATDAGFACLTATDSTIYIPGLTITDDACFAVAYYEDTAVINPGDDVMSDQYKENSYILNNVSDIESGSLGHETSRFAFRQSVIIDASFSKTATNSTNYEQIGIMALNNTIGPGLKNSNVNNDIS